MGKWLLYSLWCSGIVLTSFGLGCPQTSAPGFIGVQASNNATFTWCLGSNEWYTGNIYLNGKRIALINFGFLNSIADDFINHIHYHSTSPLCAGFLLTDVKEKFAGAYTVQLNPCTLEGATLYLYKKPDKASLKASEPNHEGNRFTLECNATSTSLLASDRPQVNMVYIWRNNSVDLDPDDLPEQFNITSSGDQANAVSDLLTITDLSRHDAGSYSCYGYESGSSLMSESSNKYVLKPLYAPGDASAGGDQTVVTGYNVTLSCSADDHGRPDGSWIWTRPGGTEVNTSDAGQLTMNEVTVMNDDGEYSCRLNNSVADGARGLVTVIVQEMPSMEVIEDVSLTNNKSLSVSCKVYARPESTVTWKYANGSSLPSSVFTWTSSLRSDGKYTLTTSYLQWTAGSSPDDRRHKGGGTTCVASNDVDDATMDFMLDVQFAPYNVQVNRSTEIIEYERLGPVLCSAVCNPSCSYSWYKGGAKVSSNARLMISNVTRGDHGGYECRPDNGIRGGQTALFDLTVYYGPVVNTFKVITPSSYINQHDNVSVSCRTDSRPTPVITLIRPNGTTLATLSTNNTLEHTFTDINCLDSGDYKCEANNVRTDRKDHKLLSIAVQCPPRKHATSDVKVGAIEGDTVTFSITAIAFPQPAFTWFFNGSQLPDQSYVTATSYSRGYVPEVYVNSNLTLSNVTQGDFGNYSVTANNTLGVMKDVVYSLIPAASPDFGPENNNDFSIVISVDMATITWTLHSYSGPITHVDVISCVSDSTNCIPTKVIAIASMVEVAVPKGGSSYTFEFRVYDGEDVILGLMYVTKGPTITCDTNLIDSQSSWDSNVK